MLCRIFELTRLAPCYYFGAATAKAAAHFWCAGLLFCASLCQIFELARLRREIT
jgi:hypothetical protein